ncbi:protoporphyrinogen oxidase, variant [Exophiala xenobiotica]|uniref:Protoporphyrinogen oxidase n=1 Tax=Exophiala xenobiotica TaxID=348802 RepID=A0A0D2D8D0_9EURO|nr:protoporphyrinogen oxidase, variant [Exophiala xenobiotica]XP_013319087.1 protoporphyrinogen oxidase [Exophiala xenobiotica]KIW58502.1 protoporphyrinogen oxidase [Exophiala xenobiotica]KIW58503.1 protoporphyrinogen oxidase, variant [Exophiala xenobiotica]
MRLGGHNALYKHAVKRAIWPQTRQCQFLRCFTSTSRNNTVELDLSFRDTPNPNAKSIAVIGGGITGLATAYNLTQRIPDAKITIYEEKDRLGGWVDSEVIKVDNGEILFEWGPRTLRPALGDSGLATVDLLKDLDLVKEVLPISKHSPAALNRFIYYPDHLVLMPGPVRGFLELLHRLWMAWDEPIYEGLISAALAEPWVALRAPDIKDESVGHFMTRRFGKNLTDNLASAFFHGIYAGDLYRLSVRTLLPKLWYLEGRDRENEPGLLLTMVALMRSRQVPVLERQVRFAGIDVREQYNTNPLRKALVALLQRSSVYTFRRGLGELTTSLETALSSNSNVTIQKSAYVDHISFKRDEKTISVSTKSPTIDKTASKFNYVVSTLGPYAKAMYLTKSRSMHADTSVKAALRRSGSSVSVMVVNLYYSNPDLIPPSYRGFGYLIPRSIPAEQNPERALGVIFSSETSGRPGGFEDNMLMYLKKMAVELAQKQGNMTHTEKHKNQNDHATSAPDSEQGELNKSRRFIPEDGKDEGQDTAPGTKLTVMMGGHWWDYWAPEDIPSPEEAIDMSKTLLRRHLGIDEEPELAKARLNRDCIPQYQVGYRDDMAKIHQALLGEYEGRLKVAGPWWQGAVGVNDCIQKARETAWAIEHQWDDHTGLEDYTKDEVWYFNDVGKRELTRDNPR